MDITRVGDSPRHSELIPSLRAIFRSPSNVEVKVLRRVSSIAQSAAEAGDEMMAVLATAEGDSAAMQTEEVLLTQKTSRQQAVTPRFGGRLANADAGESREGIKDELGCD